MNPATTDDVARKIESMMKDLDTSKVSTGEFFIIGMLSIIAGLLLNMIKASHEKAAQPEKPVEKAPE